MREIRKRTPDIANGAVIGPTTELHAANGAAIVLVICTICIVPTAAHALKLGKLSNGAETSAAAVTAASTVLAAGTYAAAVPIAPIAAALMYVNTAGCAWIAVARPVPAKIAGCVTAVAVMPFV